MYDDVSRLGRFSPEGAFGNDRTRWDLTALGNWRKAYLGAAEKDERTHNAQNEITLRLLEDGQYQVEPYVGGGSDAYDVVGNLLQVPTDSAVNLSQYVKCVYDAWNRLVRVEDKDGSPVLAEFERDALGRILRNGVAREQYFYSEAWQLLTAVHEEEPNVRRREYVWGPRYVDELCVSYAAYRDPPPRYHLQDTNWNVVATLGVVSGVMRSLEAIRYDPYGMPYFYARLPDWTGYATPPNDWESPEGTDVAFQGRWYWKVEAPGEGRLRLYDFRHRTYAPKLGRFLQRDPLGPWGDPHGRGNSYAFLADVPTRFIDPHGLQCGRVCAGDQCDLMPSCFELTRKHCKCFLMVMQRLAFAFQTSEFYGDIVGTGHTDPHGWVSMRWADQGVQLVSVGGIAGGLDVGRGRCIRISYQVRDECDEIIWHGLYHHEQDHNCYAERHDIPPEVTSWLPGDLILSEVLAYLSEVEFLTSVITRLAQCCCSSWTESSTFLPGFQAGSR